MMIKMCALIFALNLSEIFLILKRNELDTGITINAHCSSCKVSVGLIRF
jgi:hypothetical protein